MRNFFGSDTAQVEHALQVTGFAEQILDGEAVTAQFTRQVVGLVGLLHDVGIPAALKQHGSAAGPFQEQAGEPIARLLLTELNVRPDVRERVCFIVRHHHSQQFIDGLDFQILFEADALVNIPNRHAHGRLTQPLAELIAETFRTTTGRELISRWGREQGLLAE